MKDGSWHDLSYGVEHRVRRTGHHQRLAGRCNLSGNGSDLIRRLAQAKDDLGKALSDRPVMIDPREAEIFVRSLPEMAEQPFVGNRSINGATLDVIQQSFELRRSHGVMPRGR